VSQLSLPPDVLIVATKATSLDAALERVTGAPLVVPLLNGVDHVARLRARFGDDRVLAAVIRVESDRPAPGLIVQTSPFLRVDLAPDPRANGLVHLLRVAEIPAQVGDSEADVLWRKLVRLNALALTTTAYDMPLGDVRARRREELTAAVDEGAAVARAEGSTVEAGEVLEELWDAHDALTSSMARDVAAGRPPELDAIAGAVIRAGERHGIPTPAVAALADLVRERLP
jgi:2-dehydropantoate 2-reductase